MNREVFLLDGQFFPLDARLITADPTRTATRRKSRSPPLLPSDSSNSALKPASVTKGGAESRTDQVSGIPKDAQSRCCNLPSARTIERAGTHVRADDGQRCGNVMFSSGEASVQQQQQQQQQPLPQQLLLLHLYVRYWRRTCSSGNDAAALEWGLDHS
jgi:hypothetical protein